jgi:hypothetical protein
MENLNIAILIEHILPYVGADQFRFVAGVNRTFYSAYTSMYDHHKHRTSYQYINTMELFQFCYAEMKNEENAQRLLFKHATQQGNLDVFQYLREIGCSWDEWTCACAAENGHLDVLQWADTNGCPWDEKTCSYAAKNGHLDVLQWAHANGCPWDEETCTKAALNGHLDVLQWAHANGCPWNEGTCAHAAQNGHLDVLQWAHSNACPWNEQTCANAAKMVIWIYCDGHVLMAVHGIYGLVFIQH